MVYTSNLQQHTTKLLVYILTAENRNKPLTKDLQHHKVAITRDMRLTIQNACSFTKKTK